MSSPENAAVSAAILVAEHDPAVGAPLVEQLVADGYPAALARSRDHARALARATRPRLLILGSLASPRGALELLLEVRIGRGSQGIVHHTWDPDLPVIALGARAHELDLLRAFEAGADDFIAHPVSYLELRARVRALFARSAGVRDLAIVCVGALTIDTSTRTVSLRGRDMVLRRLEYELLLMLARDPERVFTRDELMLGVWGHNVGSTRTLDSHASRLRRTLRANGPDCWVLNVRGVGYRLT